MNEAWPQEWRLVLHDELPSTQDAAIEAAHQGAPGRLVILADRQTKGRGRAGRIWQAPLGNLNFSALLRPLRAAPPGYWPLLAGLACHNAIAEGLRAPAMPMLKWPNDVLLHGAKLAGTLIDSAMGAQGVPDWVVIGMGVNLASAPAIEGRLTTCLADQGTATTPKTLAMALVRQIDRWMAEDFAIIRAAWLARAHPVGTPLAIDGAPAGAFAGLSADGALLLVGHAAPIHAGDIQLAPCYSS